jgi:branched-subunit amino acid ABC-type transport system permease component
LVISTVLAVGALGFDLTFAVSRTLNIGFIAFMLIGQVAAFEFERITGSLWLVGLLASLTTGVVAVVFYQAVMAPFLRRGAKAYVVVFVQFAFYTLVSAILSITLGTQAQTLGETVWLRESIHVGSLLFTVMQLIVLAVAVGLVLGLDASLRFTKLGRDIRAISDDPDLATIRGVKVRRITTLTWGASGFLGGLAGVMLALIAASFSSQSDAPYLVLVTAAAFLGGAGKPYGALVGAVIVGVVTEVSAVWIQPNLSPLIAFAALIVTIMFRPQGLFGLGYEGFRP